MALEPTVETMYSAAIGAQRRVAGVGCRHRPL